MARPRKKKTLADHLLLKEEPKTDWQRALVHLEAHYKTYIAAVLFVLVCVAVGALIRVSLMMRDREIMSLYAEAALVEEPEERLTQYEAFVDSAGRWTAEVLYRLGETAIEAGRYDAAREAFERILGEHETSDYALHAADGLAFLDWNDGDLDAALAGFERVVAQWPNAFLARRKHYEIGMLQEERGDLEAAVAAYRRQGEVFPGSAAAERAQMALLRLQADHPDLFPEEPDLDEDALPAPDDAALTPYLPADASVSYDLDLDSETLPLTPAVPLE